MRDRPSPLPPEPALLLRIPEVGALLSISPRSVWRLIAEGKLTVVRCGRSTRMTRDSVTKFIAAGGTKHGF